MVFAAGLVLLGMSVSPIDIRPTDLRCENRPSPAIGIGEAKPILSWKAIDGQTGFEIEAASSLDRLQRGEADRWRSGKLESKLNFAVSYEGKPLKSDQETFWRLRLWLGAVPTEWSAVHRWRTGLLSGKDWKASWIEAPSDRPKPQAARNGFHTEMVGSGDIEKWVAIDLGKAQTIDSVTLYPAKPYDWPDTYTGFLFPVRFVIEIASDPSFSAPTVFYDGTASDFPRPDKPVVLRGSAVKGRHVRLRVTKLASRKEKEHGLALAEMEVRNGGDLLSRDKAVTASDSIETVAYGRRYLVDGDLESHGPLNGEAHASPVFRKAFEVKPGLARATLYATAHGVYQPLLNGKLLGNERLAPEWTDFRKRLLAQAYDLDLSPGRHVLGFYMGDGWYAGRIGMAQMLTGTGLYRYVYGDRLGLLAQLHLEYENGDTEVVVTDGSWQCLTDGPYRLTDNLDGETFEPAKVPEWTSGTWDRVRSVTRAKEPIVMQPQDPVRIERELPLRKKTTLDTDRVILDFGQNFAGVVRLKFSAPAGTMVKIRHSEMLLPDGSIYVENLRGVPATDTVTATGETGQVYEPIFTFHGFRYAEVSGIGAEQIQDATGIVFSSMPEETASFVCSNDRLNQLWSNIGWTLRSNLLAVPTDCPQRDERLGWTGDIQVFARSAAYLSDVENFLEKWSADMRDAQLPDGRYPDVAPHLAPSHNPGSFTGVPAWGDAGVIVPWRVYEHYGNRRLLERHFDSAKRWVDWIAKNNPDHIWRKSRGNDYNDWLNGDTLIAEGYPKEGGSIPNELFASLMFAQSTRMVSQMAEALGRPEAAEYRARYEEINGAILANFVSDDGTVKGDTQSGYGLCLAILQLSPDVRVKMAAKLKAAIDRYDGRISTGFVSTVPMMHQLVRHGLAKEAFQLLTSRRFPSWLYSVDQGATTIWERWDGWVAGRGFQNPGMNSFNHYAIGAVAEFMMEHVAGIALDGPITNRRFRIAPIPEGGLSWAKGRWPTRLGEVACSWELTGGEWRIEFTVPSNSVATIALPTKVTSVVESSGLAWRTVNGVLAAEAPPGTYAVRVKWPLK
ncbi:MAG: hypothetical protein HONBIEJF_01801 [Fimbriimonadaceae bacterium]|nr:hypothetical protein [Fimbriimonadaceae bacterium]